MLQAIYERALAAFPLTHFLWLSYSRYLEAHLKIPDVINAVLARAARNTPWVGAVWARSLNALERGGASEAEQAAVYQKAVVAGLQVSCTDPRRRTLSPRPWCGMGCAKAGMESSSHCRVFSVK